MDMNQSKMAFKASSSASRQVQKPMDPQNQQSTHELNDHLSQENLQQRQARMQQLTNQHLSLFWFERLLEMNNMNDHKQHMFPLARINRETKSDDKVKMISADAPLLLSKAAELLIMELTLCSWMHTETGNRRILQRADIANSISDTHVFDFLLNTVPREEDQEDEAPEGQAMPLQNVNYFPMLRAHVQQQLNAAEQMTDRNDGRNAPVLANELSFPELAPNPLSISPSPNQFSLAPPSPTQYSLPPLPSQLSLSPTPMVNEELMLGNMGGESSPRSPGTYFPFLDADGYHFNFNPVTDDEMVDRPGVEMQHQLPNEAFLGMLGLNSFNNNFNFPQNYNP